MQGLPYGPNVVTTNLQKCKRKMIDPYYKMLSLVRAANLWDNIQTHLNSTNYKKTKYIKLIIAINKKKKFVRKNNVRFYIEFI